MSRFRHCEIYRPDPESMPGWIVGSDTLTEARNCATDARRDSTCCLTLIQQLINGKWVTLETNWARGKRPKGYDPWKNLPKPTPATPTDG